MSENQSTRRLNLDENGVIAGGYDTVSSFSGSPTKGSPDHQVQYAGAKYCFATNQNKQKFESDPAHYAPQYGGWCSTAASEGSYYYSDPESYIIQDDKLYLFFNDHEGGDTRPQWEKDPENSRIEADKHWAADDLSDTNL